MDGFVGFGWRDLAGGRARGFVAEPGLLPGAGRHPRWHGRFTDDRCGGVQKFHKIPTPRIGGLALALAYGLRWPVVPEVLQPAWALIGIAGLPALAAGLPRT